MRFWERSQEENELTSIILDVNEKKSVWAKFAQTEESGCRKKCDDHVRAYFKFKFKNIKVYDIMSITNEEA